jgi:hypothetical protein
MKKVKKQEKKFSMCNKNTKLKIEKIEKITEEKKN